MKLIYPQVVQRKPEIQLYLPDITEGKQGDIRYPERDFFYKVLNSLHPDMVTDLIN